jgi:hypothetical protein
MLSQPDSSIDRDRPTIEIGVVLSLPALMPVRLNV